MTSPAPLAAASTAPARAPAATPVISARGLARTFRTKAGTVEAVRGLDLDVAEGELVAFLGPNGAGKSTSLRMLTTLLRPTAGTATVCGFDVVAEPDAVRRRIGHVGQGAGAGASQRVRDELVVQGLAFGAPRRQAVARADELLAALDLEGLADRRASTLSGGQRRRLDVALGLVHAPRVLFLDEPTTGLDPQSRANLWEHVLRLRAEHGTTVFLTTHYLEEADAMAERVLVMDHGQVIADDTAERLKADLAGDWVVLGVGDEAEGRRAAQVAERAVAAGEVVLGSVAVRVRVPDAPAALPALLAALTDAGIALRSAELRRPTLDDVFLALTGRSLREEA